jgi:hypothetical protein
LCIKLEEIQGIGDHKKAVGFLRDQGLFVDSWTRSTTSLGWADQEQGQPGHRT